MLSCLAFFKKHNNLKTGYIISTLDLKDLIDTCASDERFTPIITALIKEKPLGSNYIIRLSDEVVYEIELFQFHKSTLTIAQHLKCKNLQSCCKLFLSVEQLNCVEQLEALKKEMLTTIKPSTV